MNLIDSLTKEISAQDIVHYKALIKKINKMQNSKINVSFSGGRSSALMLKILLENYSKEDLIVTFANTGKEREETLQFVKKCGDYFGVDIIWLEARFKPYIKGEIKHKECFYIKQVDYESASREGEPFKELISNYKILPSYYRRTCTHYLKVEVIQRYLLGIGVSDYKSALGIRKDEPNRYWRLKNENRIFPLWDFNINSMDVRKFWAGMPFDLGLKSYEGNCDLCFLKGVNMRRTILKENPKIAGWWIEQEKMLNQTFETGRSVEKVLQQSKTRFKVAKDDFDVSNQNPTLFSCFCGD